MDTSPSATPGGNGGGGPSPGPSTATKEAPPKIDRGLSNLIESHAALSSVGSRQQAMESLALDSIDLESRRKQEALMTSSSALALDSPGPANQPNNAAEELTSLGEGDWATRCTATRLKSGSYPPTNLETFQLAKVSPWAQQQMLCSHISQLSIFPCIPCSLP